MSDGAFWMVFTSQMAMFSGLVYMAHHGNMGVLAAATVVVWIVWATTVAVLDKAARR